mmetsp:Transcript_19183/g.35038  ORF Transcript_19183/g.35038 Transcript_19183/m.35038 type:complete len:173 (+) Transcript_19183:3461-3979(+)
MSTLTEEERLARAVKSRENQLSEMAIQLSQHTVNVKKQETEINLLRQETQYLDQRLKLREETLMLELQSKEEIFSRVQQLEELIEKEAAKPSLVQKVFSFFSRKSEPDAPQRGSSFIGKLQVAGTTPEFKMLPKVKEDSPRHVEETKGEEEDDEDIAKELERMGLGDLVKKY